MSNLFKRKSVQPPPPLPLHALDDTISSRKSYLPPLSYTSQTKDMLLDFDSSSSESDQAPGSPNRLSIDEHQFWQAHESTTIICPPSLQQHEPITFVPYPIRKSVTPPPPQQQQRFPSLAAQVQSILGSVLEQADVEIDKEWEESRNALDKLLFTTVSSSSHVQPTVF